MGTLSPAVKRVIDGIQAKKASRKNPTPAHTGSAGSAVPAPWVQTTTEGDLSVNRKKRRGKSSLTIDMTNPTNTGTGGAGLNV